MTANLAAVFALRTVATLLCWLHQPEGTWHRWPRCQKSAMWWCADHLLW